MGRSNSKAMIPVEREVSSYLQHIFVTAFRNGISPRSQERLSGSVPGQVFASSSVVAAFNYNKFRRAGR